MTEEAPVDVLQALNKSLRILDLGCGTGTHHGPMWF